ncbi:RHS repeat domain-containing protein, partial [Bacillus zanthoxyli]
ETNGDGNVLRQYVYSIDGVRLAMKAQGQTLFYHYNPRGDVIAMTDQNGQIVATYEYDAWGNVLKSETTGIAADNPFGYAGYMYDKEIGMYYLIARYYNPEHGVLLSVDPDPGDEDDPVTQNGYTYADNNPTMMTDPDGHSPTLLINAGFALYDGYGAYKSGKGWKGIAVAAAKGAVGGGKLKLAKSMVKPLTYRGKINMVTKPYKRPSYATTNAQRKSVQGKACVTCGRKDGGKRYADHIVPLVKEYYRTGTINKKKMRRIESVQSQCARCSNRQGGQMSSYSKQQKKKRGF